MFLKYLSGPRTALSCTAAFRVTASNAAAATKTTLFLTSPVPATLEAEAPPALSPTTGSTGLLVHMWRGCFYTLQLPGCALSLCYPSLHLTSCYYVVENVRSTFAQSAAVVDSLLPQL